MKLFVAALVSSLILGFTTILFYPRASAQLMAPTPAKMTFATKKIKLAGKTITVEMADTPEKRERGLMFRESLADGHGMLFVFEDERPLSFWMMNTLIPLSIGYFDKNKKLVDVQEMVPAIAGERSPKTYPSAAPAMFALEMPKGWFNKNNVRPGAVFTYLPKP